LVIGQNTDINLAIIKSINNQSLIKEQRGNRKMSIFIIIISLGIIVGGITMLKKSARKFNLNPEQLERIKKRSKEQEDKDLKDK
jgi:hypothetical protein